MDPIAAITAVDACVKYGAIILEKCSSWKHANEEVAERIVIVEHSWMQTRHQICFIGRIHNDLDAEHCRILDNTIAILATKLSLAAAKIDRLLARDTAAASASRAGAFLTGKVRRVRYALHKDTLDEIIADLEAWQRRFDPSWFLIMRLASPAVDEQLRAYGEEQKESDLAHTRTLGTAVVSPISRAAEVRLAITATQQQQQQQKRVFLPTNSHMMTTPIGFSRAALATLLQPGTSKTELAAPRRFIVDPLPLHPGIDSVAFEADVRKLVQRLSRADPSAFGLLRSKGAVRVLSRNDSPTLVRYDLVLYAPAFLGNPPLSLRGELLRGSGSGGGLTLSRRIRLAQQLARSVADVHTFGFVHKNICPESVLVAPEGAFLVGFGAFRMAVGATVQAGDVVQEREMYRHPSRQGERPRDVYSMQHDMYSLGVVLLEMGLGESFLVYPRSTEAYVGVGVCGKSAMQGLTGWKLKDYFVGQAGSTLAHVVGERYAAVVINCLTCLDVANNDFGDADEFKDDADEIRIGVWFIEKILERLNDIVV